MVTPIEYTVQTQFGVVSVLDSGGFGPVALFIHGNSGCKEVFKKQFEGNLTNNFRFIAIDLPGHGNSKNAENPARTYSLPGYADVAIDVLKNMKVEKAAIIGWSLGGHIAIDMLKRWSGTQGILITGTPPIPLTAEGFRKGFLPVPHPHLLTQEKFSKEEAKAFIALGGIDTREAPFLLEATLRTHGLARSCLIDSMQRGIGGDQKKIVEESDKPIAIVAGVNDKGVNNAYIQDEVFYWNLWRNKIHFIDGGHGIFWEKPIRFNQIVDQFLKDLNAGKTYITEGKETKYKLIGAICILAVALLGITFFGKR